VSTIYLDNIATGTNVLHSFRSYTYNFTLSCVEASAFGEEWNQMDFESKVGKFIIARSAGKDIDGLKAEDVVTQALNGITNYDDGSEIPSTGNYTNKSDASALVSGFNQQSPGRFNFYFGDVEIDCLLGPTTKAGYTQVNTMNFSIIEPFSLGGFLEALQVSAVAAGYANMTAGIYVLKLDFQGYPDTDTSGQEIPTAYTIEPATRYFPFQFSDLKVRADDQGSKYECKAMVYNEWAFGEASKLPASVSISGNPKNSKFKKDSVGAVLNDLADQINLTIRKASGLSTDPTKFKTDEVDTYEILIPKVDDTGKILFDEVNSDIADALMADLNKDNVNTEGQNKPNPVTNPKGQSSNTVSYEKNIKIQFSNSSNIADCIAGIIRDSSYVKNIFENLQASLVDSEFIKYFIIGVKVARKDVQDNVRLKPINNYKFYVLPRRIHFSRIPGLAGVKAWDPNNVRPYVRRNYNYLYTGKNLDVLKFDINYQFLYFQSQPPDFGNYPVSAGGRDAAQADPISFVGNSSSLSNSQLRNAPPGSTPPIGPDQKLAATQASGIQTKPPQLNDPYTALTKALHKAILDNTGAMEIKLEILGDPFFLVQSGIGNIETDPNAEFDGITTVGTADYQVSDIFIEVTVKNAVDYETTGIKKGLMTFNDNTKFSGIYWVKEVQSRFSEGMFTQRVGATMMVGSTEQTGIPKATVIASWADEGTSNPNNWNDPDGESVGS
jgi:hypothetical protein